MPTKENELLPCPFCGSEEIKMVSHDYVNCRNCLARGPRIITEGLIDAFASEIDWAESWNTRVNDTQYPDEWDKALSWNLVFPKLSREKDND